MSLFLLYDAESSCQDQANEIYYNYLLKTVLDGNAVGIGEGALFTHAELILKTKAEVVAMCEFGMNGGSVDYGSPSLSYYAIKQLPDGRWGILKPDDNDLMSSDHLQES